VFVVVEVLMAVTARHRVSRRAASGLSGLFLSHSSAEGRLLGDCAGRGMSEAAGWRGAGEDE
jgi:hypothetical protein